MLTQRLPKVRFYRQKLNMSLKELSSQIGITESALSYIERGLRKPSLDVAFKLAKVLGASIEDLFGEIIQDEMSSETKYTSPSRQG